MQFRFVPSSSLSSCVEFRRVSTHSSFPLSSFAPFGACETCFTGHSGPYCLFLWQFGCCCHGGWGGRCMGLFGVLSSVCFWLRRRPLTLFGSFLFELCFL